MELEKLVVGQLSTNCYLIFDGKTRDTVIVDPGDDADYVIRRISDLRLNPLFILATHGHFDHVLGVTELKLALNIPFLMSEKDLFLLKQARSSAKHFLKIDADPIIPPDGFIKNGNIIKFGGETLKVLETPGHTPGSICLVGKKFILTGDTLFAEGVGRTDFSYSSKEDLKKSIKKLQKFSGVTAYSGHGDPFEI